MKRLITGICLLTMTMCARNVCALSPAVSELVKALADGTNTERKMREFAAANAIPIVAGKRASFIYYKPEIEPTSDRVYLTLSASGETRTIRMKKAGKAPVFYAETALDPDGGLDYCFETERDGKRNRELDPFNPAISYGKPIFSTINPSPDTRGTLNLIPALPSGSPLVYRRDITVYLPPSYQSEGDRRYPVLYMQDGQQLWDSPACAYGGWKMNTAADALILAGKIEPVIIVGINNSSRRDDELMGWSAYHRADVATKNKSADPDRILRTALDFETYILDTVKPLIDARYRTKSGREFTGTGGSSSGAMEALYLAFNDSAVFSKVAALSGGLDYYDDLVSGYLPKGRDLRIYLDCGDRDLDAELLPATERMRDALLASGFGESGALAYYPAAGMGHNERAWAERVPRFLEFLYGTPK